MTPCGDTDLGQWLVGWWQSWFIRRNVPWHSPQSNFTGSVHELDPSHVQRFNVWNYNHTVKELKEITLSLQALHCSSTGDPTSCNGLQTFVTFWMNGVTYTPGGLAYGGQQWGTNRYAGNGHIKLGSGERLVKHLFLVHYDLVTPYVDVRLVNIGSSNGLLPDGTKPLPKPMLTCFIRKVQRH